MPSVRHKISLKILNKISDLVVNDVVCQIALPLSSCKSSKSTGKHVLITIGTSLGLCVFEEQEDIYDTLKKAQSYEIAHEFLDSWGLITDRKNIDYILGDTKPRICSLFSAGGFCAYMGGISTIKNEYMLSAGKSEITKIFTENYTKERARKANIWLKQLHILCYYYLKKIGVEVEIKKFMSKVVLLMHLKKQNISKSQKIL